MMADKSELDMPQAQMAMHPKKFALWLFIVSIVMIFASLTSAYIVRQGEGNWKIYDLPNVLMVSSAILLLSSGTMQWGLYSVRKDQFNMAKESIIITLFLGILFLYLQWQGWKELVSKKIFFSGSNPSESFLYVLTGMHAFHLISGLIFLIIVLISVFKQRVHSKEYSQVEMCTTYWHFLDGLWIYLYVFLMFNR